MMQLEGFSITEACRVAELSRAGFYRHWEEDQPQQADVELRDAIQKIVLENAYHMPGLWWSRNVVHWAKVKNWVAPPSHFTNQKLQDVWLAED